MLTGRTFSTSSPAGLKNRAASPSTSPKQWDRFLLWFEEYGRPVVKLSYQSARNRGDDGERAGNRCLRPFEIHP